MDRTGGCCLKYQYQIDIVGFPWYWLVNIKVVVIQDVRSICGFLWHPTHSGITNTEFLCGKAEDVLPKHLERPPGGRGEVIGVVDPPRGGLRKLLLVCA